MTDVFRYLEDFYESVQRASDHEPKGIRVSSTGFLVCDRCGEPLDRHYAMQQDANYAGNSALAGTWGDTWGTADNPLRSPLVLGLSVFEEEGGDDDGQADKAPQENSPCDHD